MDRKDRIMHPRKLAGVDCSGGTCPAVYDDDPALEPDELAIVGKALHPAGGLHARLADCIGPYEDAVVIKRSIVAEALRPADVHVGLSGLMEALETFNYSAFRLETLQHYQGTGRDEQWEALVKAGRRFGGKTFQRVHVIGEPLTDSMRQELTEGYTSNVAAGEDIGIIPVSEKDVWPEDVPRHDFWLFDGDLLYEMDYHPDGSWAGARHVADAQRIIDAIHGREAALYRATSWRTYIASRPDLKRRLAQ
jgi:hypothetical protein